MRVLPACRKNMLPLAFMALIALVSTTTKAQLKIGTNPTTINKSAILELESNRQGFLLPRLIDTLAPSGGINALNPPDGMMIFLDPAAGSGRGLYIRKSGFWQRITTDSLGATNWSLNGNTLGTSTAVLGTLDQRSLRLVTNSLERLVIDSASGNVSIANRLAVTKTIQSADSITGKSLFATDTVKAPNLVSTDSLYLTNLQSNSSFTEVLVINTATGAVSRRAMDPETFKGWIVGNFENTDNPNGLERRSGGTNKDTLILHAASVNTPGGVSITTQAFAGAKSYRDSVLVGGTGKANSNLQITGSLSLSIRTTTTSETITSADYTILANPSATITLTLPAPAPEILGRTYIIKKIGGGIDNAVNVLGNIEGLINTTYTIYNDYSFIKIQTNGVSWYIIDKQ